VLRARQVLEDCRRATRLADDAANLQDLRICWVAAITLARAVGHVLQSVDAADNRAVADANDRLFAEWRNNRENHSVYWDFIRAERNLVLKEYAQNWSYEPTVVAVATENFELDAGLYCAIEDGPYAGADIRDMLDVAIDWWELQLGIIEAEASRV
jgi:hypothetical protein